MFIIMCGFPGSGKSVVVDSIIYQSCLLIRPSDWYPDNIDSLDLEPASRYRMAADLVSYDACIDTLSEGSDIIFDACNCNHKKLHILIRSAKNHGHVTTCVFVHSDVNQCMMRRPTIPTSVWSKYLEGIGDSLSYYKSNMDRLFVVRNAGSLEDLVRSARTMHIR